MRRRNETPADRSPADRSPAPQERVAAGAANSAAEQDAAGPAPRDRVAPPLVRFDAVGRTFAAVPPVHALTDVTFRVHAGEYVAVTGPSGSGKSTLLGLVGLLDRPTAGSYRFAGAETTSLPERDRAALRAGAIGFVFQAFHLLPYRPIEENVMLAEVYRPKGTPAPPRRTRRERAMRALDRVGLAHRAGFWPDRLSGGERQRVAIARALMGEPSLLLCDEPTGNLDGGSTAVVLDLLDELHAQGLTLLVITHDEAVAGRAGRRIRIADGRVREDPGHVRSVPATHPADGPLPRRADGTDTRGAVSQRAADRP